MKLSSLAIVFALGFFFGLNTYDNIINENTENSRDIAVYESYAECEKEEGVKCKVAPIHIYVAEPHLNK